MFEVIIEEEEGPFSKLIFHYKHTHIFTFILYNDYGTTRNSYLDI